MSIKKVHSLQRTLECAAKAFTSRRFEDVAVSEIAEEAHCSTTTIYGSYGSKEKLFLAALSYILENTTPPTVREERHANPLQSLLAYAEARARWQANPEQRRITRSVVLPNNDIRQVMHDEMVAQYAVISRAVSRAAAACIEVSLLLPFDTDVITHTILAGTTYETLVFGLTYGDDTEVDFVNLVRKVFTPLVSPKGVHTLQSYLKGMEAAGGNELRSGSLNSGSLDIAS